MWNRRSNKNARKDFYRWVVLGATFLIMVVYGGIQCSFGVFFKPLIAEFGWTRSATSGIFSLYMIMRGTFALIMGSLSDKYGSRITVAIGGISMGLGLLLTSHANAIWQLYILYSVMVGVGAGSFSTTLPATVSRWFIRRRGLALGIWASGLGVGTLIFSPLAQFLISTYTWRSSYIILAVIAWAIILPGALVIRHKPEDMGLLPDGGKINARIHDESSPKDYPEESISLKKAIRVSSFWVLLAVVVIGLLISFTPMVHIVAYATDQGVSPMIAANILAVIGASNIIGRILVGAISDRVGARNLIVVAYILQSAVLLLLVLQLRDVTILYVLGAIFGFGWGSSVPLITALTAQHFGVRSMGTIYGALQFVGLTGGALGTFMAGHIHDITGSYGIAFGTCGLLGMLGAGLSLLMPPAKVGHFGPGNKGTIIG